MKEIPLTQGKVVLVDDDDYEKLNQFNWFAHWSGWGWRALRNKWVNGKGETIFMHREILNAPKGTQVDHINGNSLDNRKENLRFCTNQQNSFNRQAQKNNKLGIKGVSWKKSHKKFMARIKVGEKVIHLGHFDSAIKAALVYQEAEKKYFGEFARKVVV